MKNCFYAHSSKSELYNIVYDNFKDNSYINIIDVDKDTDPNTGEKILNLIKKSDIAIIDITPDYPNIKSDDFDNIRPYFYNSNVMVEAGAILAIIPRNNIIFIRKKDSIENRDCLPVFFQAFNIEEYENDDDGFTIISEFITDRERYCNKYCFNSDFFDIIIEKTDKTPYIVFNQDEYLNYIQNYFIKWHSGKYTVTDYIVKLKTLQDFLTSDLDNNNQYNVGLKIFSINCNQLNDINFHIIENLFTIIEYIFYGDFTLEEGMKIYSKFYTLLIYIGLKCNKLNSKRLIELFEHVHIKYKKEIFVSNISLINVNILVTFIYKFINSILKENDAYNIECEFNEWIKNHVMLKNMTVSIGKYYNTPRDKENLLQIWELGNQT